MKPASDNGDEPVHFGSPRGLVLTVRQRRTTARLRRLVGPGAAAFFVDACRLMSIASEFDTTSHLVAHSLREIESSLRAVLLLVAEQVLGTAQKPKSSGHEWEIQRVLSALGLDNAKTTEDVVNIWLTLQGQGKPESLHGRAHRNNLDKPRPVDDEFQTFWEQVQKLLDVVTSVAETKFLEYRRHIESLEFDRAPDKKTLSMLRRSVPPSVIALEPLFAKAGEAWLQPLKDEGYFDLPWPPERTDTKYTPIRWPQGSYLERMAPIEPEIVASILCSIPESDNIAVNDSIAKCALALPFDALGIESVDSIVETLGDRLDIEYAAGLSGISLLSQHVASVVQRLVDVDMCEQAISLSGHLFAFVDRITRVDGENKRDHPGSDITDLETLMSDWDYEQLLGRIVPVLAAKTGIETLRLLCGLLSRGVAMGQSDTSSKGDDNLWITRPAIEDHEQNLPGYERVVNSLISGIRDVAGMLVRSDEYEFIDIREVLVERPLPIFTRVQMHLLTQRDVDSPTHVRELLLDRSLADNVKVHHEHYLLMNSKFESLAVEDQDEILDHIAAGPDEARIRDRFVHLDVPPSKESVEEFKTSWRRRHLAPIRHAVPDHRKDQFKSEMAGESDDDRDQFLSYVGPIVVGAQGIPTSNELMEADDVTLIETLKVWKPTGDAFAGGHDDVAMELSRATTAQPARLSKLAPAFVQFVPNYLGGMFFGLRNESAVKSDIDWDSVLDAADSFTESILGEAEPSTDQRNALVNLGSLIFDGLENAKSAIPMKHRPVVWNLISCLLQYPTQGGVDEFTDRDALTASLNEVRGVGMRSVGAYLRWVARDTGFDSDEDTGSLKPQTLEVVSVLENHLDITHEKSAAVRSVYGQMLATLFRWDRKWLEDHIEQIFPPSPKQIEMRAAAWEGFVTHHGPHSTWLELLAKQHLQAATELKRDAETANMVDIRFGELIAIYIIRGELEFGEKSSDSIASTFFRNASPELRAATIRFLSNSIERQKDNLSEDHRLRAARLWRWRVELAEGGNLGVNEELSEFGRLFSTGAISEPEGWN